MKIIQLIYSLSSGGAERFIVNLSNELTNLGHEVTICMLLTDNDESLIFNKIFLSESVSFHSMKFDRGFSLQKSNKVEKYISSQKPDIVHCHLNVIPYIFRLAFFNKKINFVHTLHNVAEHASGAKLQYGINKYFYCKNIIFPVTISKKCQESYIKYYKLHNSECIDNGTTKISPTNKYQLVVKEIDNLKTKLNTKVFIHVARFDKQKNQELLIDVFNELDKQGLDFILLILGSGFKNKNAKSLIDNSCNKIYYLGEKNNVSDYLLCSDAFCLTSFYEGLPISLLEALSAGVTPICTSVGGIPDVITDSINGYLSYDLSVSGYIKTIDRFLNNKIHREFLIKYFEDNFSIEICAKKYLQIFENTINR